LAVLSFVAIALQIGGCDQASDTATEAKLPDSPATIGVVHLTAEEMQRAGIQVKAVSKGAFRVSHDFAATVQPNANRLADITTLVRGRAMEIHVDLGQDVKAGALLATLESSELGLSQSAYLKATARLSVAERAFNRAKSLLEEKVIGQADFQRREGEWVTAQVDMREAYDRLRLLGMKDPEIGRLAQDKTIRSTVSLLAPFDARVLARNIVRGEVVDATDKLFALADLAEVWVVANVPEKDVASVHKDQAVEVRVIAYPNEMFQGQITYVGDVLDASTRTMRVRVSVPNPDTRLKPEMFASVRVWSAPESDALLVPSEAIQQDGGEAVVFVQTNPGQFERRAVALGEENAGLVQILDGLREGEVIVAHGAFELKSELATRQQESLQ
jgi:cobalt-zinc-cadmium efflux system membrane fusion protein